MMKILLPVDGSTNARRAVQYVASLPAQGQVVAVDVLNVQEPVQFSELIARAPGVEQELLQSAHETAGRKIVDAALATLKEAGIKAVGHVRTGDPAVEIAKFSAANQPSHIVLGMRGTGGVASLVLGSVVTKVIHLVEEPVTLIK
jgi:nucleotide-binding universal stress UspA family protein